MVGQASMIFGLTAVMVYAMISLVENEPDVRSFNWKGFPLFFGVVSL
jgi:hypothetical protein